jgi:hypothetical protein
MRAQSPDDHSLPMTRLPDIRTASRDLSQPPPPTPSGVSVPGAPGQSSSIQQQALQATVRLSVSDATGQSHGTGTIIDVHGDEALVLTCGHIFRQSHGQGEISVELCGRGATGPVRGQLLAYDADKRDVGLVSIRPGVAIRPARVGSADHHPQKGDPVFSVGCNHGASPTVQESTISAIDRYASKGPHVEVLGHPVEGRSGGGLFAADGHLIGVCNAADLEEDRGIYASLPTIHYELKAINLEHVFAADPALPTAAVEQRGGVESTIPAAPLYNASASLQPPAAASATEVICVVRSRGQAAHDERVMVISQPSAALLQLLEREAQGTSPDPANLPPPAIMSASRPQPSGASPPVVRAQNY